MIIKVQIICLWNKRGVVEKQNHWAGFSLWTLVSHSCLWSPVRLW